MGIEKLPGSYDPGSFCGYEIIGENYSTTTMPSFFAASCAFSREGVALRSTRRAAAAVERIDHDAVALIGDESDLLDLVLFTADDVHLDAVGLDALHGDLVGLIVGGGAAVHRAHGARRAR